VDIDSYKIDQLLVTKLSDKPAAVLPKAPEDNAPA